MTDIVQALWGGIFTGSIYGLMAVGLTLMWGAVRLLNLAHGALYVVGGYAAWTFIDHGVPLVLAVVLAVIATGAVGYAVFLIVIRPLLGRQMWDAASIIATVGVATTIQALVLLAYGPRVKKIEPFASGAYHWAGVAISRQGIVVSLIALVSLLLVYWYLGSSRQGMAIRAVSQNLDAASLMGVSVYRTYAIVVSLGAALAGLAGVVLSSILFLSPSSGFNPMVIALVVTMFGGLGSVKGTIVAAYLTGIFVSVVQVYVGSHYALPGLFLLMMIVIVVRPNGLFGRAAVQRL